MVYIKNFNKNNPARRAVWASNQSPPPNSRVWFAPKGSLIQGAEVAQWNLLLTEINRQFSHGKKESINLLYSLDIKMGQVVRTYFGLISCMLGLKPGSHMCKAGAVRFLHRGLQVRASVPEALSGEVDRSATPSECSFLLAPYPAWPPRGPPKLEHLCPGRCPAFVPRDETRGICVLVPIWGISADTGIGKWLFLFSLLFSEDSLAFWESSSLRWGHRCTIVTSGQYMKGQASFLV